MRSLSLLVPLVLVAGFNAYGADSTTEQSLKDSVRLLNSVPVQPNDPTVPDSVRPLLTRLKHTLRDVIVSAVNRAESPERAKALILGRLEALGIRVTPPVEVGPATSEAEETCRYGEIQRIAIERVGKRSDLLVVTTTLGVCCGDDSSLYLLRRGRGGWAIWLAVEASGYDSVDGAQGSFDYGVITSGGSEVYVVIADVTPWCTSNWQKLRYRVLTPTSSVENPRELLRDTRLIYLGVRPPVYTLRTERDEFALGFHGVASTDSGSAAVPQEVRYRVGGGKVSPLAK